LGKLGETLADLGRPEEARLRWQEALLVADRTGDPRATEIRARLIG